MDKKRTSLTLLSLLSLLSFNANANSVWVDTPEISLRLNEQNEVVLPVSYRYLRAERYQLENALQSVPLENTGSAPVHFDLPLPDGSSRTFTIEESPILAPALAAQYPEDKSYRVRTVDEPVMYGRVGLQSTGFYGYLLSDSGTIVIDPDASNPDHYRSFYKHDVAGIGERHFNCGVESHNHTVNHVARSANLQARNDDELRTYNLVVAATSEYADAVDALGPVPAQITKAVARVNVVYERDLGIRLSLVATPISITEGELANDDAITLIDQVKNFIEVTNGIPEASYDVGHVFSTGGGGLAALGSVCDAANKSKGVTGLPSPVGDLFYIDFVAHELGHQFGGNHTFNGTSASCGGGNRNAATAYEPGSGSSIMAYAGICGDENVQTTAINPPPAGHAPAGASEVTFHAGSIAEIYDFTRTGGGNACGTATNNGNTKPVVNAGVDFTIPGQTPFELRGFVHDVNNETVHFHWDQIDVGTATDANTYGTDLGDNPLFRTFAPTSFAAPTVAPAATAPNAIRILPRIETILSGNDDKAERLPSLTRDMNFRLMVRDSNNGIEEDNVVVKVDDLSGPFHVLTAATEVTLDSSQDQVIEWNAACTEIVDTNRVGCLNVDILLSTDSGATFPTELLADAPNIDGKATVNFGGVTSTTAFIKIVCSDDTKAFFDINDSQITLENGTGTVLTDTGAGGSYNCGTSGSAGGGGGGSSSSGGSTPSFDISGSVPTTITSNIVGTVNSIVDVTDEYQFVGTNEIYTFVLSGYGTSDLDLHLVNSTGTVLVQSTGANTTETIRIPLVEGVTYHLIVSAKDTGGTSQAYTVSTTLAAKGTATSDDGSSAMNLWVLLMLFVGRLLTGDKFRKNQG